MEVNKTQTKGQASGQELVSNLPTHVKRFYANGGGNFFNAVCSEANDDNRKVAVFWEKVCTTTK